MAEKNAAEKALEKLQAGDEKPALTPEVEREGSVIVSEFGTSEIALAHFISKIGLDLPDNFGLADWVKLAEGINTFSGANMWIVGDWLNHGEDHFGQEYAQFVDKLELAQVSQLEALRVSRRYPRASRHPNLSWSHHQAVAGVSAAEREALLSEAEINHWTREQLREEMRVREAAGKSADKKERKQRAPKPKKIAKRGMTPVQVQAFIENEFEPELKAGARAAEAFFKAVDKINEEYAEGKGITQKQAGGFADICQGTGVAIGKLEHLARRMAAFVIQEEKPPKEKKARKPKKSAAKAKADAANEKAIDGVVAQMKPENAPAGTAAQAEGIPAAEAPKKARRKGAALEPHEAGPDAA